MLVTFPDGDDQGVAICLEIQRLNWPGKIHWLVQSDPATFQDWQKRRGLGEMVQFSRLYSLRGIWIYLRASIVFYTHGALFNYAPPRRKVVVNLWHGMPIKKIWHGVPGSTVPLSTFLLSTSPFFSKVLMQASGFGPERLLVTGLPRNDFLTRRRARSDEVVARLRGGAERLILFLPTYRESAVGLKIKDGYETNTILGLSESDAQQLHAWLKFNNCKLIVKPHPMSINAGKSFIDDAHWAMIGEKSLFEQGVGLYEVLAQVDLLVTDISSVFVDFLVTQKPQILYFPDIERYDNTRGFLLHPLQDYAPGPIAETFSQLKTHLDVWRRGEDPWREQRKRLRELMVPPSPTSATEALLTAIGFDSGLGSVDLRASREL